MILNDLNHDWSMLVDSTDVSAWAAACTPLSTAVTLNDVLAATKTPAADAVLHFLVSEHLRGDRIAGRTVLQAMLPKIITMGRRWLHSQTDPMADLVTQMWIQIDTYPLGARPRKIAANLAMDAMKFVRKLWDCDSEPDVEVPPTPGSWLEAVNEASPRGADLSAAALLQEAFEQGLISARVHQILTVVYHEGLTGAEAAERLGISVDSVRFHCSRSIRTKLVPHRAELVAA